MSEKPWQIVREDGWWVLVWKHGAMEICPAHWPEAVAVDAAVDFMHKFMEDKWRDSHENVGELMRQLALAAANTSKEASDGH